MLRFGMGLILLTAMVGQASAEDFRVDNAVFNGDEKQPSTESTTIFHEGVVYDCMKSPAETVVFDKVAGRFVLLNPARKKRTELNTLQITSFLMQLRPKAAGSRDPLVRFLAEPKFQETADEEAGVVTLSSPWMTYRLTLVKEPNPNIVEQYHDFCDWCVRLNAMLVAGSRPPFGRLVANAAMAKRQAVASTVMLTIPAGRDSKQPPTVIRSEHRLVRSLEPADLERVVKIREWMTSLSPIDFNQYRKLDRSAK
ncbi:MAG: hypothetical protein ABFC77_03090 [Thermoguttaceae bacterium]